MCLLWGTCGLGKILIGFLVHGAYVFTRHAMKEGNADTPVWLSQVGSRKGLL